MRVLCFTVLIFGLASTVHAEETAERTYSRQIGLIQGVYWGADSVDARALFVGAARSAEREIPWLFVEAEGQTLYLRHGDGSPIGSLSVGSLKTLPSALAALETQLERSGYAIEGVNLRQVLLQGVSGQLDRYSRVLGGARLDRFEVRIKGTLVGIGARMGRREDRLTVLAVHADGPADRGGLEVGDQIVRIDGRSTVSLSARAAVGFIQGTLGSSVTLEVRREGRTLLLNFVREMVVVPTVNTRVLDGEVAYLSISHFSQKTAEDVGHGLEQLVKTGALERGLVLDLRGNTGGSMRAAAKVVDRFLSYGMILRTVGADGQPVAKLESRIEAMDEESDYFGSLIVLVDHKSASASEIVAGALFEADRAVLVGERTYGKGSVQKVYTLEPGIRQKLTVAHYLLRGDRAIDEHGISPDLYLRPMVFRGGDLSVPGWVDQAEDWSGLTPVIQVRGGAARDDTLELARRALIDTPGPRRLQLLSALSRIDVLQRAEASQILSAKLAEREVDWHAPAGSSTVNASEVNVRLEASQLVDRVDAVRLRVGVHNGGEQTLYRVGGFIRCPTNRRLDGLFFPVGRVDPGQTLWAGRVVRLKPGSESRVDPLEVQLVSDFQPLKPKAKTWLTSKPTLAPSFSVRSQLLLSESPAPDRVKLWVRNRSSVPATSVRLSVTALEDKRVELLGATAEIPLLLPGQESEVTLDMRLLGSGRGAVPLSLNIDVERYGRSVSGWTLALAQSGQTSTWRAPQVQQAHPLRVTAGAYQYAVDLADDGPIQSAVLWKSHQKIAWTASSEGKKSWLVPVQLAPGQNVFTLVVTDTDDLKTRERVSIWAD